MAPPLHIVAIALISGKSELIDLLMQFDDVKRGAGTAVGHMQDTCVVVPQCIQKKKGSRLLLDVALDFIAIAINSTPNIAKQLLLDQVKKLLGALQPLRAYYKC